MSNKRGTHLSSCWSNRPSPPEVVSAGGSAPSAVARDRTQTLPLPARVAARQRDWRQKPRTVPSYCDTGCAGKTGIGWRTTFWGCSCRRFRRAAPDLPSTLLSSLYLGPLSGPTSLSSTVLRLFKDDVVQRRPPRDQLPPAKQKKITVIAGRSVAFEKCMRAEKANRKRERDDKTQRESLRRK